MQKSYVHGYAPRENRRLQDQASTLEQLLHSDTAFPSGARVLEVGCGVGAQTVPLARNSPEALITSIDVNPESVAQAKRRVAVAGLTNVTLQTADLFNLPFAPGSFDHIFVCFVLEHLPHPTEVVRTLLAFLRPEGTLTVIEGDHGSVFFHPDSVMAQRAVAAQVELQRRAGGDAMIGRRLYPLLTSAGLRSVQASARMVYVDGSRPELADGFTRKTFTAMIEGVRQPAVEAGLMNAADFDQGIRDLYRTAEPDGVFCYTFFKATGVR